MKKVPFLSSRSRIGEGTFFAFILIFCFLVVLFTLKDYGTSYDEGDLYIYANSNIDAYISFAYGQPIDQFFTFSNLRYYGPAYLIVGKAARQTIAAVLPGLGDVDAWHLVNFATFLASAWLLYCLCQRFTSKKAALLAGLLYVTQPLLWGHGIMNPKDTPFLAFFLATIVSGMKMVEQAARPTPPELKEKSRRVFSRRAKIVFTLGGIGLALILVDRVFSNWITLPWITSLLSDAYSSTSTSILHSIFARVAAQASALPLTAYVEKVVRWINLVEFILLGLAALSGVIYLLLKTNTRNRWIVLAGITAGITVSIRVLGPAAVGLVGLYAVLSLKKQALPWILGYLAVSVGIAFIFWPYLWNDPAVRFMESLRYMANFPWSGSVRFDGNEFLANNLPWYYLPKLITIQLSLPVIVGTMAGLGLAAYLSVRRKLDWKIAIIPALWFLVPLFATILLRPNMYDNFRQFLFILPPLFIFTAITFDVILRRVKAVRWVGVFAVVVLLPGIIAGIWLHPYEYVYYNALVGWTGHVERQYETDYYQTAMCEAGRYVGSHSPSGTTVAFTDDLLGSLFARCTTGIHPAFAERVEKSLINPDYSVISTRYDDDIDYFRKMKIVQTIGRGSTLFTVIKHRP
jgi:4-amino-4-deoxy-L-arabinose transferase-like glycosyltransferase